MDTALGRILRLRDVMLETGLSRAGIYRKIAAREFPRPVKIGAASGWIEAEISSWKRGLVAARDRAG